MTALDVSVVICAHTLERWDDLTAAVASVQRQDATAREIIVSIDDNPELLERAGHAFEEALVVANAQLPGVAGAKNTGAQAAKGAIVAFLDDDATAEADWLGLLAAGFEDDEVIGVGGAVVPVWPEQRPAWFPEEFDWVVGCTYRGMPVGRAAVRNFIGANMAFRREVFERVSFFPGIGHAGGRPLGGSDPDFCIRVSTSFPGRVLLYEPSARVHHRVTPERARWSYFVRRCLNEGTAKGVLTRRVGWQDALRSERAYTRHVLPSAVARGVSGAIRGRRRSSALNAAAVVAGFAITAAGYAVGVLRRSLRRPASQ